MWEAVPNPNLSRQQSRGLREERTVGLFIQVSEIRALAGEAALSNGWREKPRNRTVSIEFRRRENIAGQQLGNGLQFELGMQPILKWAFY